MEIRPLSIPDFDEVVECFNLAFSDYFVPFVVTRDSLWGRWKSANVDTRLSFGAFDGDRLVGFISSGIGKWNGKKTVYNAGTGVIPSYRGRRIIAQIYEHAIPIFKANGIHHSILEVIDQNERAIKVYERVGFEKKRDLYCMKVANLLPGELISGSVQCIVKPWTNESFKEFIPLVPTWDNSLMCLENKKQALSAYVVSNAGEINGIALVDSNSKFIAQVFVLDPEDTIIFSHLLYKLAQQSREWTINNIDHEHSDFRAILEKNGFVLNVKQYEMEAEW